MATIKLKGNSTQTKGNLPQVGSQAPDFKLTGSDLSTVSLTKFKGQKVVLNIFPSLDTSVCATSVRKFNQEAASLENVVVLCISKDLPFAHSRFCTTEGIVKVVSLSEFKDLNFSSAYGVAIADGPLEGLMSRAVVTIDPNGKVLYTEQVPEITQEPDYDKALASVK
jgi:thioredoxin-dependent peroxiredoxin